MSQSQPGRNTREEEARRLFERADREWDRKNLRLALRLFRAAARAGDPGALLNVGYFYDKGVGVQRNRSAALYWYKRAFHRGDAHAANNIATIWRDEHKINRALLWFHKAAELGADGANLEIAKHYIQDEYDPPKAVRYLAKVCESQMVSEADVEEAKRLLKGIKGAARRRLRDDP